jgi:hypothetical protein
MATQTADGKKKFGSSMVAKRYDSFHPKESSYDGGDQPKMESTPMKHGGDAEVNNFSGSEAHDNPRDTHADAGTPSEVVQHHGVASEIEYTHDHEAGEHGLKSTHEDGHVHQAAFKDPALMYEAGGELQADSVRRRTHPDQSGASSEGDNDRVPQHEAADLA